MNALDIVGGLLLTGFMVWNQLRTRQVALRRLVALPVILVALGLLQVGPNITRTSLAVLLLAVGLILAVVLGVARGFAIKIWVGADGSFWRRGGALLAALWLVSLAAKAGLDYAGAAGGAAFSGSAILMELGVTLAAQNLVVAVRSYGWGRLTGALPTRRSP